RIVDAYVSKLLTDWQAKGWVPDMRIEPGYNTDQPSRERGWTHWQHLFNPRQLLVAGLVRQLATATTYPALTQVLNWSSRLSVWNRLQRGGGGNVQQTFINQALNTLFEYGCRPFSRLTGFLVNSYSAFPIDAHTVVRCHPAVS